MMNATAATFSEVTFARADLISPTAFKSAFRVPRRVADKKKKKKKKGGKKGKK